MALGFTPVATKQVKLPDKTTKLTPIAEIQANLSHYFSEIKDPRVTRTKKHLLKDILVIAIREHVNFVRTDELVKNGNINENKGRNTS